MRATPDFGTPVVPYTTVPNGFLDFLMADCTGAETKAFLYIARRTRGTTKGRANGSDAIALSQICGGIVKRDGTRLDRGTGLARAAAVEALYRLEFAGIIERDRGNGRTPDTWRLAAELPTTKVQAPEKRFRKRTASGSESEPLTGSKSELVAVQKSNSQKKVEKESEKESSSSGVPAIQQHDDEPSFSEKTEPGKPEDLDRLVSVARDQLRAARAAGAGVLLEQIDSPDREITVQILGAFSDGADFESWLKGTVQRGLARKSKSAGWGLFSTDAKNQAEDLRMKRETAEKGEKDWALELERRQAAETEQRRVLDVPVPIAEAAALVQCAIPWPLQARLERTGEGIIPTELERQARAWHRCVACRDAGTTGSAIDSDLRFCGCVAGIEAQYRDGAGWPEEETARVHADAKALLVEACRALDLQFAGDGLEAAGIVDDGVVLKVDLAPEHAICVIESDVKEALGRVRWQRVVRIIRPGAAMPADEARAPVNGTAPRLITQADVEALMAQRGAAR